MPTKVKFLSIIFFCVLVFVTFAGHVIGFPGGGLTSKEADKAAKLRIAGLHGDRTQIPAMRDALKEDNHMVFRVVALRALAQMGAREALPTITAMANGEDYKIKDRATIARARLIAEDSVRTMANGPAKAATKVARFYQEMKLTPETLNAAVIAQYQEAIQGNTSPILETRATRELADMAYQSRSADYLTIPGIALLALDKDYASKLKIQLAAKSSSERITTLVQKLVNSKILGTEEDFEMQLLIDEGADANRAVSEQLREMKMHRENYLSEGFGAMFRVLHGFGNKEDAPLIAQFLAEPGKLGYSDAEQVNYEIQNGWGSQYAVGY